MQYFSLEGAYVLPQLAMLFFNELRLFIGLTSEIVVDQLVFN
jgi:hypothetical protein